MSAPLCDSATAEAAHHYTSVNLVGVLYSDVTGGRAVLWCTWWGCYTLMYLVVVLYIGEPGVGAEPW